MYSGVEDDAAFTVFSLGRVRELVWQSGGETYQNFLFFVGLWVGEIGAVSFPAVKLHVPGEKSERLRPFVPVIGAHLPGRKVVLDITEHGIPFLRRIALIHDEVTA